MHLLTKSAAGSIPPVFFHSAYADWCLGQKHPQPGGQHRVSAGRLINGDLGLIKRALPLPQILFSYFYPSAAGTRLDPTLLPGSMTLTVALFIRDLSRRICKYANLRLDLSATTRLHALPSLKFVAQYITTVKEQ